MFDRARCDYDVSIVGLDDRFLLEAPRKLRQKRCGLNGAATIKMMSKTRRTSINGVTLIVGAGISRLVRSWLPPCEKVADLDTSADEKVPMRCLTRVALRKHHTLRLRIQPRQSSSMILDFTRPASFGLTR